MPFATLGSESLYYELRGSEGDPVALVHGSFVDHHSWDLVLPGLAQGFQVLSYDRRGHGASSAGPRRRPVAEDAADLAGVIETTSLYPTHLVAHSYGGAVAIHLAAHRPDLVRSVSIHEPPFLSLLMEDAAREAEAEEALREIRTLQAMVRSGRAEEAARRFVDRFSLQEGAWDRLPATVRATFVAHAGRWAEEFDDPEALGPARSELSEILVPALLTVGEESPGILRHVAEVLSAELPYAQVLTLPETGHVPHLTRPDLFVGVLGTFLLERNVPPT